MMNIFIDTDILIDFSFDKDEILEPLFAKQKRGELVLKINPVVMAEFLADRLLSGSKQKEEKACQFLQFFEIVEITAKTGILAGRFLREGKIQFLGDALIAATCIIQNLQLATRNKKHYQKVSGLQLYQDKDK